MACAAIAVRLTRPHALVCRPVVGVCCKDGAILAVEKAVESKMVLPKSNRRIFTVDKHVGAAVCGNLPDGRQIVSRAQAEAENYKRFYGLPIPTRVVCDRLANFCHLFSLYWSLRPLGSAAMVAAFDDAGPHVYLVETNGETYRYKGMAVGKGRQGIKTELERLSLGTMTCQQCLPQLAKVLLKARDDSGSDKEFEIEMAWITEDTDRRFVRVPDDLTAAAERDAKAEIEAEEME